MYCEFSVELALPIRTANRAGHEYLSPLPPPLLVWHVTSCIRCQRGRMTLRADIGSNNLAKKETSLSITVGLLVKEHKSPRRRHQGNCAPFCATPQSGMSVHDSRVHQRDQFKIFCFQKPGLALPPRVGGVRVQ